VVVPERTDALRTLHPLAWWCWAIGIGLAVNGTTNPLLLILVALSMVTVVMLRRSDSPWARSVRAYLVLAAFVIGMRLFFQLLLGGGRGETVLFTLPSVPLPAWAAGIQLGGVVTAEAIAYTVYDALRLAALYEASVAVVVALSVAPQLIESGQRIHRARRLRGDSSRGLRSLGRIALAVLADAIDRSMSLAAGMEARGFARTRGLHVRGALPLMLASVLSATTGGYLMLATDYRWLAAALMVAGVAGTGLGLRRAGARLAVTSYRPHPWQWRETLVAGCGVVAMLVVLGIGGLDPDQLGPALAAVLDPLAFFPSTNPLAWPQLNGWMLAVVALVLAPIPLTRTGLQRIPDAARTDVAVRSPRPRGRLAEAVR